MEKSLIRVWFFTEIPAFAEIIGRALGAEFELRTSAASPENFRELENWWDVALLDLGQLTAEAAEKGGVPLIDQINMVTLPPPIVALLGLHAPALAPRVIEAGAFDTIAHPLDVAELRLMLRRAQKFRDVARKLHQMHVQESGGSRLHELLGSSETMQQVFTLARKIAPCDVNVLVTGETGTGKELLARAIHRLSSRSGGPFVAFSCVNLPETLVEDELFGHERGAFTGAIAPRRGRFEAADQGTLFLDEIGDLPLGLQAKLLRVVQERSIERLGNNTVIGVNIRLICATHCNLAEMVMQGKFREDLFYRLNVVQMHLPPLRERREEIPLLAHHFLNRFNQQFAKKVRRVSRATLHALEEYSWPGNVRELENIIQRGVVLAEGAAIELWHLPVRMRNGFVAEEPNSSYEDEVRGFKRRLIVRTLHECGWRKAETARTLGVARGYLHRLINQLQILPGDESTDPLVVPEEFPIKRVM